MTRISSHHIILQSGRNDVKFTDFLRIFEIISQQCVGDNWPKWQELKRQMAGYFVCMRDGISDPEILEAHVLRVDKTTPRIFRKDCMCYVGTHTRGTSRFHRLQQTDITDIQMHICICNVFNKMTLKTIEFQEKYYPYTPTINQSTLQQGCNHAVSEI